MLAMGDLPLTFEDDTVVWLRLAPVSNAAAPRPANPDPDRPGGGPPPGAEPTELELPDGFGAAHPVSADGRAARALSRGGEALGQALRPLSGVLDGIHRSLADSTRRPDEVTVEFGVTLGTDLSLGVFTGSGEASFTVSATWHLDRAATPPAADPAVAPDRGTAN